MVPVLLTVLLLGSAVDTLPFPNFPLNGLCNIGKMESGTNGLVRNEFRYAGSNEAFDVTPVHRACTNANYSVGSIILLRW